MKKYILTVMLLITALSFAGTKEDYESAVKKYSENSDKKQLETSLLNIIKQNEDDYTIRASLLLTQIKFQDGKYGDAKIYAQKVANSSKAPTDAKTDAYKLLFAIAEQTNKLKDQDSALTNLAKLDPKDLSIGILEIIYAAKNNDKSRQNAAYKRITQDLSKLEKEELDFTLGMQYVSIGKNDLAKSVAEQLKKSSDKHSKSLGYYLHAFILSDSNVVEAIKYAKLANDTEAKNPTYLSLLFNLYLQNGQLEKAFDISKKIYEITPDVHDVQIANIILGEQLGNSDYSKKVYDKFKAKLDGNDKKILNGVIATTAYNGFNNPTVAKKYALKALNEDKQDQMNLLLGLIYAHQGDLDQAIKYAKIAKDKKIENSDTLLQELLKLHQAAKNN